jgi:hypothetical protein
LAAGETRVAALICVAVLVAGGLALEVDLPWEGEISLGYALVIAVAVLLPPVDALAVCGLSLALVLPARWRRRREVGAWTIAAVAAIAAQWLVRSFLPVVLWRDAYVLLETCVAGAAFLVVDLLLRGRRLQHVSALYASILCAAALLTLAYQRSSALALVAVVPLLVTKYSFERFSDARHTYSQTTQALSLLPEVAGLTPLGHGERTALYATALADELGIDAARAERLATAARLHHLGYISLHEPEVRTGPPDLVRIGELSAEVLRETGFLADIADLVRDAQDGGAPAESLDAAIIRVCSTLDDLAGDGFARPADPVAEVLRRHAGGFERTASIALLRLHDRRPDLIDDARAASRRLALAASGSHAH